MGGQASLRSERPAPELPSWQVGHGLGPPPLSAKWGAEAGMAGEEWGGGQLQSDIFQGVCKARPETRRRRWR